MASNMLEFKSIETDLYNLFTCYLKITTIFLISTAFQVAQKDHITLSAYVLGGLNEDKINQIIEFLNDKLKMADEEGE